MPDYGHCHFYEWDEDSFKIPEEYILDSSNDLADALKVFYSAGGFHFFNVEDPKYYAGNWLDFMGNLYTSIADGEFTPKSKPYIIPLSDDEKRSLSERNVPKVFITDIKVNI